MICLLIHTNIEKKILITSYNHNLKKIYIFFYRCYINFVDSRPSMVGYNGSTFHDILGGN